MFAQIFRRTLLQQKIVLLLLLSFLVACANQPKPSLYDELGQYEGIDNIVRELIFIIAKDERIKARYKGVNMQHFKKGLSDYICEVADGPCEYANENMKQVHAGHNYTNTEFNAIVDNLIMAMERRRVPVATQNKLLAKLARDYKDVVYQ